MKIDIWSDVVCPYCYVGKRRFEKALANFEHKDKVTVEYHSFQLYPHAQSHTDKNAYDYLAEIKGITREDSAQMHKFVVSMAAKEGLEYNFDIAKPANTFDAHRVIQLAKTHGLGAEAEEALFDAYFTRGRNIADHATLGEIGEGIGLSKQVVSEMLASTALSENVLADIQLAQQLGIEGVPFFLLDGKYGVSGAQRVELFSQALRTTWDEANTPHQV